MVKLTSLIESFIVDFTPSSDLDISGYKTHVVKAADLVNGDFVPTADNMVNHGPDTNFTVEAPGGGMFYIKVAAYDTFGEDVLNYSSIHSVNVIVNDSLDQVPPNAPAWGTCLTGIDNSSAQDNIYISLTWLLTEPEDFSNYILAYKKSTDANWTETSTTIKTHRLNNLIAGVTYQFQIKAVDRWNNASDFVSYNSGNGLVAAKDTVAPAVPSMSPAVAAFKNVFVKWTANTESDFKEYILQVDDNSSFTSPEEFRCQTNSFTYQSAVGVTSYFKVASIDYSGNTSVYSSTVSATTATVVAADIDNFAVDASKIYSAVPVIKEAASSVWTANTPANGISWAAHTVVYKSKIFTVNAGSTTLAYVNANLSVAAGTISYTGSATQAATTDNFTMAKNTIGKLEIVWQSQANMVIGSAYIMDGAIGNAKIGTLDADKITAGTLDCDLVTMKNLTFTDVGGSISWTDPKITSKPTSVATLNATDGSKLTYIGSDGLYSGTINVEKLTAGTFAGGGIGFSTGATVNLDGTNARIAVNDGTRDRVYIGKLGTGDYGVDIQNAAGLSVVKVSNAAGAVIQNATVGNLTVSGTGGILCGSGASSFKVWESAAGNMSMYLGNTGGQSIQWDGATLAINAKVTMSADSTISWSNITTGTGKPADNATVGATWGTNLSNIPDLVKSDGTTVLGSNYVYTGTLVAGQISTLELNADKITSGTITGRTIRTGDGVTAGQIERFIVDAESNSAKFYDSAGTIKVWIGTSNVTLAGTGITTYGTFGGDTDTRTGLISTSGTGLGIWGYSYSNVGIRGTSYTGYGGVFDGAKIVEVNGDQWFGSNGSKGPIRLGPSSLTTAPTHAAHCGTLWVTRAGVLYINTSPPGGLETTTWQKVGAQ